MGFFYRFNKLITNNPVIAAWRQSYEIISFLQNLLKNLYEDNSLRSR